ncbi:MAG: pilus assembly protein PilE, partial [Burkholderiaceae bacterium]
TRMEHFYKDNDTYAKAGGCGEATPASVDGFAIACVVAAGGQAFTATATGVGSTSGFVYSIDHANVRATTALPSHWGSLPLDAGSTWVTR